MYVYQMVYVPFDMCCQLSPFGGFSCQQLCRDRLHGTRLYYPQASTRFWRSASLLPTFFSTFLILREVAFLWVQQL